MEKLTDIILKLFKFDNIAQNFTGFIEARVELFKLEIRTDLAKAMAKAVTLIFLGFLGFLFLLFISLGLAFLLNNILESHFVGFIIVGGIYGVLSLIAISSRKKITTSIEDQILKISKQKEK